MDTSSTDINPNQEERRSRFELRTLLETSRLLIESQEPDFVLNNLLLITMGKLLVPKGMILINQGSDKKYQVSKVKGRCPFSEGDIIKLNFDSKLLDQPTLRASEVPEVAGQMDLPDNSIFFNLRTTNHHLGFLCLGPKGNKSELTQNEIEFIESLSIISSVAIANSRMFQELRLINRKLDRKVHDLHTLLELSKDFNMMVDQQDIARTFKFAMLGQMLIRTFFFALEVEGEKSVVASSGLKEQPSERELERLFELDDVFRCDEAEHNCPFLEKNGLKLVIALRFQNEKIGVVGVGEPANKATYGEEEVNFLQSLGNLALLNIQKTYLLKERIEKQRMEEELNLAKTIQQGLLPSPLPTIPGFDLDASNVSSYQVGGDYFDVVETPDGGHVLAIADVTGKGVPASLLMANLQSMLHALAPIDVTLPEATSSINDIIYENTPADKFITFFWGKISDDGSRFDFVNAGHNPPLLFRKGEDSPRQLDAGGVILGAMPSMTPYDTSSLEFQPGDVLVFFTDGVTEAMNPDQTEEYEEERLKACISKNLDKSSSEIMQAIVDDVQNFSDGIQYDDITLMVLKVH
ncbi:SpoIIE family protein phosphatase [Gracilimonas mengyeensis]|uniref:Sigma-B regulation protein RsbU (Phosphoserine phosphatase) n=1 Tax=Gracilimonas mengyeensis TaxID=1302730 RepID=A0A521EHJ4_9BACT|nr:SpoIIE family protein phosphatase [Gracilimonas mengyeensis]SMO82941.1 sigma-B regulation protein RsbU (phosphoserine phosphatase) [Gracilimonas mengyeensis]